MKTSIKCPKCGDIMLLTLEKEPMVLATKREQVMFYHTCLSCGYTTEKQKLVR